MSKAEPPKASDLGSKISIRLHDPAGGFRDLLGILVAINQVQKKDGSIHTFNPSEIEIWKVVTGETTMRRKS